jgi:hypothetical protein
LGGARIVRFELHSSFVDGAPAVVESWGIAFVKVQIDYVMQSELGARTGSTSFTGDAAPA